MKIKILVALLLFLPTMAFTQKLVLVNPLTNKTVKVKEGKLLGVITIKDTLDPYFYKDSTYERGTAGYRPDGIWRLNKIDDDNNSIQLKPINSTHIKTYTIDEIKYFQYRKEKDSRYRESLFWIGAVGCTFIGIANLFDNDASLTPKIGFLTVGVLSSVWFFGTSNRTETKKYKFVRIELRK